MTRESPDSQEFSAEPGPYRNPRSFQPFRGVMALFALMCMVAMIACHSGRRSYSGSESATASEQGGVQPAGDPRFPRSYATRRRGFWVDVPRQTGTVSPTAVAQGVARHIETFDECCDICAGQRGQFTVRLSVRPNGRTSKVTLVESPTSDDKVRSCITDAVGESRYPSADRPYEVVVPIHFDQRSRDAAKSDTGT